MKPFLASGSPLADNMVRLLGGGPGQSIGMLFLIVGLLSTTVAMLGFLLPRVRRLEQEIPDAPLSAAR
jgi:hypothetical protein